MKNYWKKNFDHAKYKSAQEKVNKAKLKVVWVKEEEIELVSNWLKEHKPGMKFGICHASRNGFEVEKFRECLNIDVIGTDISETANKLPHMIQWDMHDMKDKWINNVDFIYSNSINHTYNINMCLDNWFKCLNDDGILVLHLGDGHFEKRSLGPVDCFRATKEEYKNIINERGEIIDIAENVVKIKRGYQSRHIWIIKKHTVKNIPEKKAIPTEKKNILTMDFTTTAMARPDVVDRTYASFSKNLKGIDLKECRLFINIDPLPPNVDREKVTEAAKKYFKEVYPNYPQKPNFTAAINWLWLNAQTEYIFHLEDDWSLLEKVSMPELLKYFKKYPELMEVALRAYRYVYKSCVLSPGILHKRFYKQVAGKLNEEINPEIQLRGKNFGIKMPSTSLKLPPNGKIIAYPEECNKIILKDIGRGWLKKSKYTRPKKKGHFITWDGKKKKK